MAFSPVLILIFGSKIREESKFIKLLEEPYLSPPLVTETEVMSPFTTGLNEGFPPKVYPIPVFPSTEISIGG